MTNSSRILAGLALALVLAPAVAAAQRPNRTHPPPAPGQVVRPAEQAPTNARESTMVAITAVAREVAQVRSGLDLLRRSSFNDPDGVLTERAELLRNRCAALARVAAQKQRVICRNCQNARVQAAFDAYRNHLPAVATLGRSCATRVDALRTGPSPAVRLRSESRQLTTDMTTSLRRYEDRINQIQDAMGWNVQSPARPQD